MKRNKASGFTLVEIQIALLILLLIMAVLMGGLQLASKSTKAAEELAMQSNNMRVISTLLKRQISSILPLKALHNGKAKLIFKGERNEVYYTGYLPEHVVDGGPWLIHLYTEKKQLLLDYRVIDTEQSINDNFTGNFETIMLLDNVDDFSIDYYREQTSVWQSNWHKRDVMPALIKIQLSQDGASWPDLVIQIQSHLAVKTPFHVLEIK